MNGWLETLLWVTYLSALYFAIFWLLAFWEKREIFNKEDKRDSKLNKYPKVSIIIPAFNAEKTIEQCMRTAIDLDYPKDKIDVIVINDGSSDATEQKIRQFIAQHKRHDIKLISQQNIGKAASMNNALKLAKGEFFACLDSDSFVDRKALKKMVKVFMTHGDDLKIVIPALKIYSPKNLLQKIQEIEYMISIFLNRILSHFDSNYVAPGPFSLYRKNAVIETGGFDEHNLTEDQEIAYRMQSRQHDITQCPDAYVHTVVPESLKSLSKQRRRWYKGGLINVIKYRKIILNKEYGHFGMFQLPLILFLSMGAVATVIFFNYMVVWPLLKSTYNFYLVGFDIMPYIRTFSISFDLLDIDAAKSIMAVSVLIFASCIAILSIKNAKEKISAKTVLYLFPYFLIFYIMMSFIAVFSLFEILIGRTQKW